MPAIKNLFLAFLYKISEYGYACNLNLPAELFHVYFKIPRDLHALFYEHIPLHFPPAEREAVCERAVFEHDSVAGNYALLGVDVQRPADLTGHFGVARKAGYVSVREDFARGDLFDYFIYAYEKIHRIYRNEEDILCCF